MTTTTVTINPDLPLNLIAAMFMGVENGDTNSHPVASANLLACVEKRGELKNKKFSDQLAGDATLEDAFKKLLTDAGKSADFANVAVIAMKFAGGQTGDTIDTGTIIDALEEKTKPLINGGITDLDDDDDDDDEKKKYSPETQVFRDGLRAYAKYVLGKKLEENEHETLRTSKELGADLPEWTEFRKKVPSYSADNTYNPAAQAVADDVSKEQTGAKEADAAKLAAPKDVASPADQPGETRKFVRYTHAPISQETVDGLATLSAQAGEHASRREREKAQSARRLAVLLAVVRTYKEKDTLRLIRGALFFEKYDDVVIRRSDVAVEILRLAPQELLDAAGWTSAEAIAADLSNEFGNLALECGDWSALAKELERLIHATTS